MDRQRQLREAFGSAHYLLEGDLDVRVSQLDPAIDRWLDARGAKCAAVITAYNPAGTRQPDERNRRAQHQLLAAVSELGLTWARGSASGDDWPVEPMLVLMDVTEQVAQGLCRRFGQAAMLWLAQGRAPELIWTEGS